MKKKIEKEQLEKMIFEEKKSYREIGRIYEVSDTYVKKIAKKLGIILQVRKKFKEGHEPSNKGVFKTLKCKNCEINYKASSLNRKYCSNKCQVIFRVNEKYKHYIDNQEEYCYDRNIDFLKKHILKEQECNCNICGIKNVWFGKKLVFVIDHIDGDAKNNLRDNLRLICSNCDSQLDTYKSKNKNSSRKERYIKRYKQI